MNACKTLNAGLMRIIGTIARFAHARNGIAAVEFAIILPVALMLYAGAAEVADGVSASRSLNLLTRTLDDLGAQQPTSPQTLSTPTPSNALTSANLSALMTSATVLMGSQPTSTLSMTLSAIDVRNNILGVCCVVTVRWSYTQGGTLRPCITNLTAGLAGITGSPTTIPAQLMPTGTPLPQPLSLIVAETNYVYQPILSSKILNFAPPMARIAYTMPRSTGQVITGPLPASGAQHGVVCY